MNVSTMSLMVNTNKLEQIRAFYTEHLDFRVSFDGAGYLGLSSADGNAEVGFMTPCPERNSMSYGGEGITLCLEVKSPDAEHERLREKGIDICMPLDNYPWGDRAFTVADPAGVQVYLYSKGKPTPEFAEYVKD